jgi:hypothetical protein
MNTLQKIVNNTSSLVVTTPGSGRTAVADFREEQPNGNKTKGISRIENPNMVSG